MKSYLGPNKTGFEQNTKKFATQNIFLVSCVNKLSICILVNRNVY